MNVRMKEETRLSELVSHPDMFSSQGSTKPFKKVIDVSSCDPHRAGMAPISFVRQVSVLSVCVCLCVFVYLLYLVSCAPVISLTATN